MQRIDRSSNFIDWISYNGEISVIAREDGLLLEAGYDIPDDNVIIGPVLLSWEDIEQLRLVAVNN